MRRVCSTSKRLAPACTQQWRNVSLATNVTVRRKRNYCCRCFCLSFNLFAAVDFRCDRCQFTDARRLRLLEGLPDRALFARRARASHSRRHRQRHATRRGARLARLRKVKIFNVFNITQVHCWFAVSPVVRSLHGFLLTSMPRNRCASSRSGFISVTRRA